MKVLVVGGGSGGHITPAVAVLREILEKAPGTKAEFWTDRKYYRNVVKITTEIGVRWGSEVQRGTKKNPYIRVRKICAGKFRRYAGWTTRDWFKNWRIVLKDLVFGNFVGFLGFVGGIIQSFFRLLLPKQRPDVIFLKGGFVCLPVGLVAHKLGVPYVVHESDSVPGLANRLLMKNAMVVAYGWRCGRSSSGNVPAQDASVAPVVTGLRRSSSAVASGSLREELPKLPDDNGQVGRPLEMYVGVPVAGEFREVSEVQQKALKKGFGYDPEKPLVVVTGGSQGAENINDAMAEILPEMLKFTSVALVAGRKHYERMVELKKYEDWERAKLVSNFRMWEFNSAMHELLGAADVVVSRAGATTIAELAALGKAVILVPFERLPGGHQLRNAQDLEERKAVKMVADARMRNQPGILLEEVRHLVRSPRERADLAERLHKEAAPDAAERLAKIVMEIGGRGR